MLLIRDKWNRRYAEKTGPLSSVPVALQLGCSLLKRGSVLDLACGDGGSSVFLARQGFEVTAVDIAEEGLKRLDAFAEAEQLKMVTVQLDLDDTASLDGLGFYDNIIINCFRPTPALFCYLPTLLSPQGKLMLNSFNVQQNEKKGFSERFCLTHQEYLQLSSQLEIDYYRSEEREGDYMDEYLFSKI